MLSLFAFLLVIGVVVDDAIIVGESIHNQVEENGAGMDKAILGAQLVAKPVLFAVLTNHDRLFAVAVYFGRRGAVHQTHHLYDYLCADLLA